jgi:hypothetical protein
MAYGGLNSKVENNAVLCTSVANRQLVFEQDITEKLNALDKKASSNELTLSIIKESVSEIRADLKDIGKTIKTNYGG